MGKSSYPFRPNTPNMTGSVGQAMADLVAEDFHLLSGVEQGMRFSSMYPRGGSPIEMIPLESI